LFVFSECRFKTIENTYLIFTILILNIVVCWLTGVEPHFIAL